jgi:NAD(P)-dependent dehydrogenase (short-subunit alcohol dehydrogenase family)
MKKIVIIGGTGGLGVQLAPKLSDYQVTALGSSDLDVRDQEKVFIYFKNNPADIVINLSGYNRDSFIHKLGPHNQEAVDNQIDINIKGNLNILSACLPSMRENGYGRVVMISSVLAEKPVVSTGVYSGCKGFLDSLAKTVAVENASKNVTCNTIQLGYFDGGLTYNIPESFRNQILETIPSKRWGTINELENTVRFLINTPYVNGTSIKVNGGIDF